MWKLARDYHNNDASDDGDGSATASRCTKDDDYDNAHGRRVLIATAVRDCVCRRHGLVGRLRGSKSGAEFNEPPPVDTVENTVQDF